MYLGQGRGRSSASQINKLPYNADEENEERPNQDCPRNNNRCQSTCIGKTSRISHKYLVCLKRLRCKPDLHRSQSNCSEGKYGDVVSKMVPEMATKCAEPADQVSLDPVVFDEAVNPVEPFEDQNARTCTVCLLLLDNHYSCRLFVQPAPPSLPKRLPPAKSISL